MASIGIAEIEAAIHSWHLVGIVIAKKQNGRVAIEYKGQVTVFPAWLALQKINQIGAEYRPE